MGIPERPRFDYVIDDRVIEVTLPFLFRLGMLFRRRLAVGVEVYTQQDPGTYEIHCRGVWSPKRRPVMPPDVKRQLVRDDFVDDESWDWYQRHALNAEDL